MTTTPTYNHIPALRFPEFQNNGEWKFVHGNELFEPIVNKNHNSDLPVLAITQDQGAVPRDLIDYKVIVSEKSVAGYKVVEVGDFIISLRSFQGGIEYSNYKGLCSPAYIILRKKNDTICNDFYRYYFKSSRFITDLNRNIEGIRDGKMISYQQFSDIILPYPPLAEQRRIAESLSSIDEMISNTNKKYEQLKSYKRGLMQQLFISSMGGGKILIINNLKIPSLRFPEFANDKEWDEKKLGEIVMRITDRNKENNQNVLTISAQYGLVGQYDYFNKNIASADVSNYYLINKGDFAYNKSRSQGHPYGAIKSLRLYKKGVLSPLYICFRTKGKDYDCDFLEYYFDTDLIDEEIGKIAQEGARNHGLLNISTTEFFDNVTIFVPTLPEQRKIARCLSSIDENINAYTEKVVQLGQYKKGLMQQLFVNI